MGLLWLESKDGHRACGSCWSIVTPKPQSLGEFGPTPSVFQTAASPRILVTAPRDTQVPSPGIPGYLAKAGSQWLVIVVPVVELGHVTRSPCTRVCGVNTGVLREHGRAVRRLCRGDGSRCSYCFVFLLIKTFPFSCTFASREQGPEVPLCGGVGLW